MPTGRHGQGCRFLCVANWSPAKGIHVLIEATARLAPAVHLDLVGEGGHGR